MTLNLYGGLHLQELVDNTFEFISARKLEMVRVLFKLCGKELNPFFTDQNFSHVVAI